MADRIKAVIYGDSVMKGTVMDKAYRYRAIMAENLKRFGERFRIDTDNRARFGVTVSKGYSLLKRDLSEGLQSDYALIEFGGNDCSFRWNEVSIRPDTDHEPLTRIEEFRRLYREMLKDLLAAGVKPILMTLPPIDAERYLSFLDRNGNDGQQILKWLGDVHLIYRFHESYSNAIARIAEDTATPIVDVRGYFLDKHNFRDLMCIDGIHPNEAGHMLVYQAFEDFARKKLVVG